MDRLDLEAARAIQHPREQLARALPRDRIIGFAQRHQVGGKVAILQTDPGREPRADAVGHLGGRRLGESQAQDRFRPRTLQQQAQHPRRQDLRLSRPRRRRQRRVHHRVRRKRLLALQFRQGPEPRPHAASNAPRDAIEGRE